jgi:dephospho-CoA kinase
MSRSVVLVTGMSGSGKSTVLQALGRRGSQVVDTDDPGWIVDVATPHGHEPLWNLDRIGALLDAHRHGRLFVAGCVANQGLLYSRFDAVALLTAPVEILLARVVDRPNPFGSQIADRLAIAADVAAFEPVLRADADLVITTTAPVDDVAAVLERLAIEAGGEGRGRRCVTRPT